VSKANLSNWHPKDVERNPALPKAVRRGDKKIGRGTALALASDNATTRILSLKRESRGQRPLDSSLRLTVRS